MVSKAIAPISSINDMSAMASCRNMQISQEAKIQI
jgi:hypothetical protein